MTRAALAPTPPPAPPAFGWRGSAVAVGIGVAVGLAQASQIVFGTASSPRPIPWTPALIGSLSATLLWVLFVPFIFLIARRFPLNNARWPASLVAHIVAGAAIVVLYSAGRTALTEFVTPEDYRLSRHFRMMVRSIQHQSPASSGAAQAPLRPPRPPPPRDFPSPPFLSQVRLLLTREASLYLITYAVIVGAWHWLAQQHRLREGDRRAQELSRQLADARLQALRMQLNPHFLFNTLNAIATLIHRDPKTADDMIACLSDFLRLTLNSGSDPENSFSRELEFARRYLEIEKLRFGERLAIHEEIDPACLPVLVPTLILQPLLENAIRHGIERSENAGVIRLAARRVGEQMALVVSDSGPGLGSAEESRGGIGLSNTRARLQEIHGDLAALTLSDRPGGGLEVEIRLPWRLAL